MRTSTHARAHEIAGRITAVYHFTTVLFQTPSLVGPNDGVLTGLWADLANTTDAERGEAGAAQALCIRQTCLRSIRASNMIMKCQFPVFFAHTLASDRSEREREEREEPELALSMIGGSALWGTDSDVLLAMAEDELTGYPHRRGILVHISSRTHLIVAAICRSGKWTARSDAFRACLKERGERAAARRARNFVWITKQFLSADTPLPLQK